MRIADICPTCAIYTNAVCVVYDGLYLSNIDASPLQTLDVILGNINTNLVPVSGSGVPTSGARYIGQLYVDTTTAKIYYAKSVGLGALDWVEITTTPLSVADLSFVLSNGNTASNNISLVSSGGSINLISTTLTPTINVAYTSGTYATLEPDSLTFSDGFNPISILANVYNSQSFILPSIGGVLPVSVNGVTADSFGEISLPSVSLQDVALVSPVTDQPISVVDFIGSPTQTATINPSNLQFLDVVPGLDLTTTYGVTDIVSVDNGTGDSITLNLNNLQNQVIDFPATSGTLALLSDIPPITYKSYVAKISQTGASAPTVDYVMENTLTNAITFSYVSPGIYLINCVDFTTAKTVAFFQQGSGTTGSDFMLSCSTGSISFTAWNSSSTQNDLFTSSSLEIRVYN